MISESSRYTKSLSRKRRPPMASFLKEKIILAVDDQVIIRKMIKNFLTTLGVSVLNIEEADDGDTALEIIEEVRGYVGIVLLDWNMPRLSGLEVLKKMKSDPGLREIPVLMVTAETNEERITRAVEEGIDGYLIKPFTATDLEEKILNIFDPPSYAKTMEEAEKLMENGEDAAAVSLLEDVLGQKPDSAGARLLLGRAHRNLGDDETAGRYYREAAEKNPNYLKALKTLAQFLLEKGKRGEALRALVQADRISPLMAERKITIGRIYLEKGDQEKARQAFEGALALEPGRMEEVAEACLDREEADLATEYITRSVTARRKKRPKLSGDDKTGFINMYNSAGISYRKKGQWREAIAAYMAALDVDPANAVVHFNMGKAYAEGAKKREAMQFFEKALALNRESGEPDPDIPKLIEEQINRL
ncbi:MAG: response regulator [Candidatus Nitrospinota bacterium M3_3B_026]